MPRPSVVVTALAVGLLVLAGCVSSGSPAPRAAGSPSTAAGRRGTGPSPSRPARPSKSTSPSEPAGPQPPKTTPPGPPPPSSGSPRAGATRRGPAGSIKGTGSDAVALTFDDGPDPGHTPQILDLLKANGVKATFCLVGFRARDEPDLVRRIVAEGHTLCNHSWQHLLNLGQLTPDEIRHDLQQTNDAIHAAAPGAPIKYFRAPGGNFTPVLVDVARELGMRSIHWNVDPRDWDRATYGTGQPMVNHIIWAVQRYTRPGSIVLSHDAKPDTIAAYGQLLPWLKARFTLIPLPT